MRLLHEWEIEALLTLVNKQTNEEYDDFEEKEIVAINENLRKNVKYYINNYITFMPQIDPKSIYINLRIKDNLIETITGI